MALMELRGPSKPLTELGTPTTALLELGAPSNTLNCDSLQGYQ